jgi:hypothetical protein
LISPVKGTPSLLSEWPRKTSTKLVKSRGSDTQDRMQESIQVMTVIWTFVGVVVLAGAVTVALKFRRRSHADVLSLTVADVMGTEWASRLGTDVESVRGAILRGEPANLRDQLTALIADVTVSFDVAAQNNVRVSVRCQYADRESVTVNSARISWDLVPAKVREQYLRTGEKLARCQWFVADPEPSPS